MLPKCVNGFVLYGGENQSAVVVLYKHTPEVEQGSGEFAHKEGETGVAEEVFHSWTPRIKEQLEHGNNILGELVRRVGQAEEIKRGTPFLCGVKINYVFDSLLGDCGKEIFRHVAMRIDRAYTSTS